MPAFSVWFYVVYFAITCPQLPGRSNRCSPLRISQREFVMSQQRIPRFWISAAIFLMICPPTSTAPGLNQDGHQREVAEHVARAAAAIQDRDFERGEEEWKKVVRLDPGSAQAFNNLGLIYYLEH